VATLPLPIKFERKSIQACLHYFHAAWFYLSYPYDVVYVAAGIVMFAGSVSQAVCPAWTVSYMSTCVTLRDPVTKEFQP
jgi:hypothetical protein